MKYHCDVQSQSKIPPLNKSTLLRIQGVSRSALTNSSACQVNSPMLPSSKTTDTIVHKICPQCLAYFPVHSQTCWLCRSDLTSVSVESSPSNPIVTAEQREAAQTRDRRLGITFLGGTLLLIALSILVLIGTAAQNEFIQVIPLQALLIPASITASLTALLYFKSRSRGSESGTDNLVTATWALSGFLLVTIGLLFILAGATFVAFFQTCLTDFKVH